jgi:hypothetical protein
LSGEDTLSKHGKNIQNPFTGQNTPSGCRRRKNDPVKCEAALKAWTSIAEIDKAAQEKPRPKDRG